MKIYIAGKITGDKDYRYKFAKAEAALIAHGHIALNPANNPDGLTLEEHMKIDSVLMSIADAVLFLPDWTGSRGATLEYQMCNYTGKAILFDIP